MILDVLKFIFQDFWHWLGTVIIIEIICGMFTGIVLINKNDKE